MALWDFREDVRLRLPSMKATKCGKLGGGSGGLQCNFLLSSFQAPGQADGPAAAYGHPFHLVSSLPVAYPPLDGRGLPVSRIACGDACAPNAPRMRRETRPTSSATAPGESTMCDTSSHLFWP